MEEISYASGRSSNKKRLSKRLVIFGGLFILVLVLLGSAVYFITQDGSDTSETDETASIITLPPDKEITETPAPTGEAETTPKDTTPTRSPSASPTLASSKSDVSIAVQNGSGVTGAAADAAQVLKTAGFTIFSTGNADNSDYTDVTIRIKNSAKSNLSAVEDALSDDYTVGETSTNLPENSSYDVLVIIGS